MVVLEAGLGAAEVEGVEERGQRGDGLLPEDIAAAAEPFDEVGGEVVGRGGEGGGGLGAVALAVGFEEFDVDGIGHVPRGVEGVVVEQLQLGEVDVGILLGPVVEGVEYGGAGLEGREAVEEVADIDAHLVALVVVEAEDVASRGGLEGGGEFGALVPVEEGVFDVAAFGELAAEFGDDGFLGVGAAVEDVEVGVGTLEAHVVEHGGELAADRGLDLDHIGVVGAEFAAGCHGVDDVDAGVACEGGGLVEGVAEEEGDDEVGTRGATRGEGLAHFVGAVVGDVDDVEVDAHAAVGQLVEGEAEAFVEFDEFELAVGLLAALFDVEFGGGYLVDLTQMQGHEERDAEGLSGLGYGGDLGGRRLEVGGRRLGGGGRRLGGGYGALGPGGWGSGGGLGLGGHVAVFVLLGLGAELAAVGQPDGVAWVEEVDVLVGDGVEGLHLVGSRYGIDGLPFLHDVDVVAAAVDDLGLIADLHRGGAGGLGPGGIEN